MSSSPLDRSCGRLQAAQQLVEGMQHLLGQSLADLVLVTGGCPRAARRGRWGRGRLSSRRSWSSRRMAAAIGRPAVCTMSATRKSSQPELSPRGAEIRRSARPLKSRPAGTAGVAQQALQASVRRGFQAVPGVRGAVEVGARLADLDEKLPVRSAGGAVRRRGRRPAGGRRGARRGRRGLSRPRPHREIRAQHRAGLRERRFELGRQGRLVRARVALRREAPAEHGAGEGAEVRQPGLRFVPGRKQRSPAQSQSSRCPSTSRRSRIAPARSRAGAETTSPGGPHEPDPLQVSGDVVGRGHGQFVSGHR